MVFPVKVGVELATGVDVGYGAPGSHYRWEAIVSLVWEWESWWIYGGDWVCLRVWSGGEDGPQGIVCHIGAAGGCEMTEDVSGMHRRSRSCGPTGLLASG